MSTQELEEFLTEEEKEKAFALGIIQLCRLKLAELEQEVMSDEQRFST